MNPNSRPRDDGYITYSSLALVGALIAVAIAVVLLRPATSTERLITTGAGPALVRHPDTVIDVRVRDAKTGKTRLVQLPQGTGDIITSGSILDCKVRQPVKVAGVQLLAEKLTSCQPAKAVPAAPRPR